MYEVNSSPQLMAKLDDLSQKIDTLWHLEPILLMIHLPFVPFALAHLILPNHAPLVPPTLI